MAVEANDCSSETIDDSIAVGSDEPSDISNCNSVADDCINPSQEVVFPQETVSLFYTI